VKVRLLSSFGDLAGEPDVPLPLPRVVVWGNDTYVRGADSVSGQPQYHWNACYVVPDTQETFRVPESENGEGGSTSS
jgi:hypothetical protein